MTEIEKTLQAEYLYEKVYSKLCDEKEEVLQHEGKDVIIERFLRDDTSRTPSQTMADLIWASVLNVINVEYNEIDAETDGCGNRFCSCSECGMRAMCA